MTDKKEEVVNFDFHNKLKKMYLKPREFFKSVESEKSYQSLLRNFVLFYVFYLVVLLAIQMTTGIANPLEGLVAFIVGVIFAVTLAFVFPLVIQFFLIISGSKKGFFNTYKAGIYALIMWTGYSVLLLIVSLIIPFDSLGLQNALTNTPDNLIAGGVNFLTSNPGSLISLLLSVIVHIHVLIFGVMALSHFQKISNGKASFAVISTAVILFVIQIIILVVIETQRIGLT